MRSVKIAALLLVASVSPALAQDSSQIATGKKIYAEFCTLCHGPDGKRGEGFQTPIWGKGSFIASKFGDANTMFDYMQTMPFNDPTLIDDVQRLAVMAYVLSEHGAIPASAEITLQSASSIPIK